MLYVPFYLSGCDILFYVENSLTRHTYTQQYIGGTNTVYAWLVQWLAENLGYDVSSIVALPYDWRLSPDKLESRDGFLTQTRRKIEAAVELSE